MIGGAAGGRTGSLSDLGMKSAAWRLRRKILTSAVKLVRENTGIRYARTIISSHSFDLQETCCNSSPRFTTTASGIKCLNLPKNFALIPESPALFISGALLRFDIYNTWDKFETLPPISGQKDIFCGTNREVFGL